VLAALSDAEKSLNQYDHALPSIAAQETAAATNWATPHSPISRPRSPCRTPVPRRTWSRCTKRLAGMGSTDGTVASACAVQMSVSLHSIVFIGYSSIRHGLRACRERRLSDSADACSRPKTDLQDYEKQTFERLNSADASFLAVRWNDVLDIL